MLIKTINIITTTPFGTIRGKVANVCMTIDNVAKIIFGTITRFTYISRFRDRVAIFVEFYGKDTKGKDSRPGVLIFSPKFSGLP